MTSTIDRHDARILHERDLTSTIPPEFTRRTQPQVIPKLFAALRVPVTLR